MSTYNVHAGHCPAGSGACGVVGILNESVENRKVKNRVITALRNNGHTVYDCTDDSNCSVNKNLANIVSKCNAHSVNLDVSIHLNAGGGKGVEVWCYDSGTADIASRICAKVSSALGIPNRGVKYTKEFYVLSNTKAPALLVECCFVDSQSDANAWNTDKCGDAIASGILNKTVSVTPAAKTSANVQLYTPNNTAAQNWIVEHNTDGTISLRSASCGLYLDVSGGAAKSKANIQVYTGNKTKAQKFILEEATGTYNPVTTKPFLIKSALDKTMCLDCSAGGVSSGTNIQLYKQNGTKAQIWGINDRGNGTWTIINIASSKALDVVGGGK